MKNILVPTDFSKPANRASEIAIAIAEQTNSEIHFLHIQYTPVPWITLNKEREERYPETLKEIGYAKGELSRLVKKAEDKGLKAEQFLVFDEGREEILKHIPFHHHDFVVMGSSGATGAKELLIGSNAQKILRDATIPVLVVKEGSVWPVENIVFPSSFESNVKQPFQTVVEFADLNDSKIHLLYVNTPFSFEETEQSMAKMHDFHKTCPRGGSCTLNIYNSLNEERGIMQFVDSIGAGLIAITTHGRSGFLRLISKSITESLANHTEIPVLSINLSS